MHNFKSFKRVAIPILPGFTAIVGPNGSGKSNIVDAICFVLGRSSSKSLRAERFSDLIFNGGKSGKAAEHAEVSLYVDNSDRKIPLESKEIKITRSLDTSGKSVYRLNDRNTSRTEILDILLAAMIQPDGHNIVLQGDVTGLIEMTPIERRGIIDEIAGIAEYDEKKRKALKELDKVTGNIAKVDVVLREVNEQYEKLRKERDDALRHGELKKEIRELSYRLLRSNLAEIEGALEKLNGSLEGNEKRGKDIEKHLGILSSKLALKKTLLKELEKDLSVKEGEQLEAYKELERLKSEASYWKEKMTGGRASLEEFDKRSRKLKDDMEEAKAQIRQTEKKSTALKKEKQDLDLEINKLKKEVEKEYSKMSEEDKTLLAKKEELLETRRNFDDKQLALFDIKREIAILKELSSEKKKVFDESDTANKERNEKRNGLRKAYEGFVKERNELYTSIEKDSKLRNANYEKLSKIKKDLKDLDEHHDSKKEELGRLEARENLFEEIKKQKVSLNKAVDEILGLRDTKKMEGVHGTIGELGRVDEGHSKALEVAAGRGLNYLVVRDDRVAESGIKHLMEKKIGRATFLPLNKLKRYPRSAKAEEVAKRAHGFAVDLVKFDKRFEKAFEHVFKDTIVVEDIDFARKVGIGSCRMVTLDGTLIEPSGSMSGGYSGKSPVGFESGVSKAEIEALRKELEEVLAKEKELLGQEDELKKEIETITAREIENLKRKEALNEKIAAHEERVRELDAELKEGSEVSKRLSRDLEGLDSRIKDHEKELKELSEVFSKLNKEKKHLEEMLEKSKAQKIMKRIKELENELSSLEKQREEKKNKISLNKSMVSEVLEPKVSDFEKEIKELASRREELNSQLETFSETDKEVATNLDIAKAREGESKAKLDALRRERELHLNSTSKIEDKISTIRQERENIAKEMEFARIEKARLETRMEDVRASLTEYEDMKLETEEQIDAIEAKKRIVRMEREMLSLEPINMKAIEDFEEVKVRHENLDEKIDKLNREKEGILGLMEEIEHRKHAVFMEVFENISLNFGGIFSQLSGGGEADLLLDEETPLEGGLQITAKPPGKNPQRIEMLSGGEKTLTALSFIFAIQRYQPAPFYILDEVDMFLDDDNLKKISGLIQESAKEGQFIVVSLKNSLMASADQLFGVSSEEGVSKIVGVEFEEIGA